MIFTCWIAKRNYFC